MTQREELTEQVDRAADGMVSKLAELEDRAVEIKDDIRAKLSLEVQVEENPWRVLGVAAGAGFVLGLLLS